MWLGWPGGHWQVAVLGGQGHAGGYLSGAGGGRKDICQAMREAMRETCDRVGDAVEVDI